MKSDKKTKEDKKIFSLIRELDKLRKASWDAPLIPLDKPYQNGWIKYFTLRDDYTRRNDSLVYNKILKEINVEVFCRKKDFIDSKGNLYGPNLRIIGKNEWDTLNWPIYYKKYFSYGIFKERYYYGWKGTREGYKFFRPFCFIEAIKPHFVTHTRVIYPKIESRIKEIKNTFDINQYWNRFNNLKGYRKTSSDYRLFKTRYLEALGTKEIENYIFSE